MKKNAAYIIILIIGLAIGIYIFTYYFSDWDLTGSVTETYYNESSYMIEVN
ncbi:hypothetical protein [Virgibacillus kimchii]